MKDSTKTTIGNAQEVDYFVMRGVIIMCVFFIGAMLGMYGQHIRDKKEFSKVLKSVHPCYVKVGKQVHEFNECLLILKDKYDLHSYSKEKRYRRT